MYKILSTLILLVSIPCAGFSQAPLIDVNSVFKLNIYSSDINHNLYMFAGYGTATVIKTYKIDELTNLAYLVTCAHVVDYDEFRTKTKYELVSKIFTESILCKVVYTDYKYDVAILECILPANIKAVELEDDDYKIKTGDDLQYIGFGDDGSPYGPASRNPRITCGKSLMITDYINTYIDQIIVGGDSGSIIINKDGKCVGIMRRFGEPNLNTPKKDGYPSVGYNQKVINRALRSLKLN